MKHRDTPGDAISNLHNMLEAKLDQMLEIMRDIRAAQQDAGSQMRSLVEMTVTTHTRTESLQQHATVSMLVTPRMYPSLATEDLSAPQPVSHKTQAQQASGQTKWKTMRDTYRRYVGNGSVRGRMPSSIRLMLPATR
jgi:hypothetical protein